MTRIALISATAIASILGAALPAFAQAPAPAPMYAPAPAPAPAMAPAPAPAPEGAVMPAAPMMAPRAADDMTGSVGFGVNVVGGGTSLVTIPAAPTLMMKYWMSDAMSIVPRLAIEMTKVKGSSSVWSVSPQVLANFVLLKGASTRLDAGLGLGLAIAKNYAATTPPPTIRPLS